MTMLFRILLVSFTLALAGTAAAQATPAEKARDIISGLTTRSALPRPEVLGRVEAAPPEVCREIGAQLSLLKPHEATPVAEALSDSRNPFAHGALLIALASPNEGIRTQCLDALVTLSFAEILGLGDAAGQIQARLFEGLREDGHWAKAIQEKVTALCTVDERTRGDKAYEHQMASLALVVDVYGGEKGFEMLVGELLRLMVGEKAADAVEPNGDEPPPAVNGEPEPAAPAVQGAEAAEKERIRVMHDRRKGAVSMFRRLLLLDPDGFFQLGQSAPYERRVERAASFWERYGGVDMETKSPDDEKRERSRLINNDYVRRRGPVRTWRAHIDWVQREAPTRDEQVLALILMDELCGGITVPGPKPEPKEGEKVDPNDPPPEIPAITGETLGLKVETFLGLDARTEQRPRIRAIRAAFESKLMKRE